MFGFHQKTLRYRICGLAALLLWTLLALPAASAQDRPEQIEIVVREGQTLRQLAGRYLEDPDLWRELLRASGLSSPAEVRPGVRLQVPRNEVTLALRTLDDARLAIREATEIGAQVLAGAELRDAVALHDRALGRRTARDWAACHELALRAETAAKQALASARGQRSAKSTASLTTYTGRAEAWPPGDLGWQRATAGKRLVEREKVRTLARSSALVTFLDDSRLELGAESQAVIEKVRVDKLRGRASAGVSLVQGDMMALLRGSKSGQAVEIEVPGLKQTSRDFWVAKDGKTTHFANYDDEEMVVESVGSTVALGKNQGTLLVAGGAPMAPRDLLPAPTPLTPEDGAVSYDDSLVLRWQPVDGAVAYRVEVGRDAELRDLVRSPERAGGTEHRLTGLANGRYYWRLASIDDLEIPGPRGRARRVRILRDTTPPFLRIAAPDHDADAMTPASTAMVPVTGKTEPSARVVIGSEKVTIEPSGDFTHSIRLAADEQSVVAVATDHAGNHTRRELQLIRDEGPAVALTFAPELPRLGPRVFVARRPQMVLSGSARAHAELRVTGGDWSARTRSDAQGAFDLIIPLPAERQDFELTLDDGETGERFTVVVDDQPPSLEVDAPIAHTRADRLRLTGRAIDATEIRVQGSVLEATSFDLESGRFDVDVPLVPGANRLHLVALDQVGNQAFWQATVISDAEAPKLLGHRARRQVVPAGEVLELEIEATDPSDLRQTARVAMRVGGARREAFLRLDADRRTYRGRIALPTRAQDLRSLHVDLEDSLGNHKTYALGTSLISP